MFDLKDYFSRITDQIRKNINKSDESYERIVCQICNRICYNKKESKNSFKERTSRSSLTTNENLNPLFTIS